MPAKSLIDTDDQQLAAAALNAVARANPDRLSTVARRGLGRLALVRGWRPRAEGGGEIFSVQLHAADQGLMDACLPPATLSSESFLAGLAYALHLAPDAFGPPCYLRLKGEPILLESLGPQARGGTHQ